MLYKLSGPELKELGLRPWNDPWDLADEFGGQLWLLPAEWYRHIPKGFQLVTIKNQRIRFVPGQTDDDMRFGVLSYGILERVINPSPQVCSQAEHAKFIASCKGADGFVAKVRKPREWPELHLIVGECPNCNSTLAIPMPGYEREFEDE